jgi:integrase
VRGIPKLREVGRRLVYLPPNGPEEPALREALPPELQPPFTLSLHTGLRWGEQRALRWHDVDVLSGLITVGHSKNGTSRQVPMNAVVRSTLVDLSAQRKRLNDPDELIFDGAYRTVARLFSNAVHKAQTGLRAAGKDASRLEGYTWHSNRHSFASRLVIRARGAQQPPANGWARDANTEAPLLNVFQPPSSCTVLRSTPAANAVELARN